MNCISSLKPAPAPTSTTACPETATNFAASSPRAPAPTRTPLVSVIMPVYNGGAFLRECLDSILGQTLDNFEFIVVDDASTDNTPELLHTYQSDKRLRLLRLVRNSGQAAALNLALAEARGKFLAHMDADDISYPDRLAAQVAFMEANPAVLVAGGAIDLFGRESYHRDYPADDAALRGGLLFQAPFAHPFVIFRGDFMRCHNIRYDEKFRHAEDYELWLRLAHNFPDCRFANLPQTLGRYRLHKANLSRQSQQGGFTIRAQYPYLAALTGQLPTTTRVSSGTQTSCMADYAGSAGSVAPVSSAALSGEPTNQFEQSGHPGLLSKEDLQIHFELYNNEFKVNGRGEFERKKAWLLRLLDCNAARRIYPDQIFCLNVAEKFHGLCVKNIRLGSWVYEELLRFPGLDGLNLGADKLELLRRMSESRS